MRVTTVMMGIMADLRPLVLYSMCNMSCTAAT